MFIFGREGEGPRPKSDWARIRYDKEAWVRPVSGFELKAHVQKLKIYKIKDKIKDECLLGYDD